MPKESTAKFIAYNLRPAKQAERRLLLDFLKCKGQAGPAISSCRYVGMGGNLFYDFHLLHRFFGIKHMVSLERDSAMYKRATFNCPFHSIDVLNESVADFLAVDKNPKNTIYWLDYDDGISEQILSDIIALGTKVALDGCAFVTVYGGAPGIMLKQNSVQRLEMMQVAFGDFATDFTPQDLDNANMPRTVDTILMRAFVNAFAARPDGTFLPWFRIRYKDTQEMVTVGGCFVNKDKVSIIRKYMKEDLPFLLDAGQSYKLPSLNLTEKERALFDRAVTKKPMSKSKEARALKGLGFKTSDLNAYRELIRFMPRYHESII